jgi:hypothetical protein
MTRQEAEKPPKEAGNDIVNETIEGTKAVDSG